MLAQENRKKGMMEVLKEWLAYKDQDLRELEEDIRSGSGSVTGEKSSSSGVLDCLERAVRK